MKDIIKKWYSAHKAKKAAEVPKTFTEELVSWLKTIVGAVIFVMIINGLLVASFVVPTGSMERTVMTGDFLFVNKFIFGPSTPQIIPFINVPLPFYRFPGVRDPKKGDVIVFIFPGFRDEAESSEFQYYLKRCVAVAGDSLEIRDNILYVNGKKSIFPEFAVMDNTMPDDPMEPLRTFPKGKNFTHDNYGPIRIPKKGDVVQLTPESLAQWETFILREGHNVSMGVDKVYIDGKPVSAYKVERDYCFGMGDNRDHSLDSRFWGFVPYENVLGTPLVVYWSWPMQDEYNNDMGIIDKIKNVRWSRIGSIID